MKKFFIVLGIIVFFVVCIAFTKDQIIKTVVTVVASKIIGAPVYMDSFSMNISNSTIHIAGFKIYNPSGFPQGMLMSCPEINVNYDRTSLFRKKPHLFLVEFDLQEMVLTKNKEGKLNVDSLRIVQQAKSSPAVLMQIDRLNLNIGKIINKDYTKDAEPSVRVYNVNRHKIYKGVPSAQQLALLVLYEPMKAAAIKDAEIYGVVLAAGMAGVAVLPALPVAIGVTFIGRDTVQQSINAGFEQTYELSLKVVKRMGKITKQDEANGIIKADINGSRVALILRKDTGNKTKITISARKYMFPERAIAGGVLYQILDQL